MEKQNELNKQIPYTKGMDHQKESLRLKKAIGQLKGIEKMILEKRYCVDILIQLKAVGSAISKIEGSILKRHIECSLYEAALSKNKKTVQRKIEELVELIGLY
ncbi:MAG: metal-sensitive transcriptional regulator [Bacteriovoracaceae bacterium]|nr:metal-sensitive transcriptional regulator [Bacteriovoracaceae bacterium]